ncbi:MAG TPA: hypothetical protein VLN57_20945 [Xanthobacteraceae bacterium]|nr:hypothetical protein [Xanthobacteraceae bacterium]
MISLLVCRGDFEQQWIAALCAEGELEQAEHECEEDLEREEELALEHAYADEPDEWPWYAEAPSEAEAGEIIEDADLLGWPVAETDEVDPDDEIALDAQEGEDE